MYRIFSLLILILLLLILFGKIVLSGGSGLLFLYGFLVSLVLVTTFFVSFFLYRDPYVVAQKKKYSRQPLVSCMVAVHNEENIIDRCILSLLEQTYSNLEIIFVDDASTDKTREVLEAYASDPRVKLIFLDANVGKKRGLGKAILAAKGEYFIFSDSDSILKSDVAEKVVAIFESDPLIGAISGHCRVLNVEENIWTKIQDSWYEGQFSIRKAFESVFGSVTCVSGPLAAFRRQAIYNFIPAWEEDQFLGQEFRFATDRTLTAFVLGAKIIGGKFRKKYANSPFVFRNRYKLENWKVVYSKATRSWTAVPNTFGRMLYQQVRWKKSFLRNMFFTGAFYWRKPILSALVYYLHILFVLTGPFIVMYHFWLLAEGKDMTTPVLYLLGIISVGLAFAAAYKYENPDSHLWMYRPLMSLLSTLLFSLLLFYSAITIRQSIWKRG